MLQRQKYKAHQCGGSHMQKYQGQRQFLCKMAEHAYEGNQDSFAYGEDPVSYTHLDGQWQYVSNHILPSEENRIPAYTARFTEEEWEKYYGDVQKGQ